MKEVDPAIRFTRDVRHRISKRVGHDPEKMLQYYLALQRKYESRLLREQENLTGIVETAEHRPTMRSRGPPE